MNKSIIIGLLLFLAVIGLYCGAGAIRQSHTKKAILLKIPTVSEMTAEENAEQENLFNGDKVLRIYVIAEKKTTYAVYTLAEISKHGVKNAGDTISVNKFFNAGMYLVEG